MKSHQFRLAIAWRKSWIFFNIINFEVTASFTTGDLTGFSFSIFFSTLYVFVVKVLAIFIWMNTEITVYFIFERSTIIFVIITQLLIEEIIIPIDIQISIIFIVWYCIFTIITHTRSRFRVDFGVCIPWNRSEFKFIFTSYRAYSWFRFIFIFFFLSFSSLDVIIYIHIISLFQFIHFLIQFFILSS